MDAAEEERKTGEEDKQIAVVSLENRAEVEITDIVEASEGAYTKAEFDRLLWKIDLILWICGGVQQADKTSISTQATFGLRTDTHLVGQQYSWLSTVFYLTYLVCEFPGNIILQRFNVGRALGCFMFAWGIIVLCVAFAKNFADLMVLRALQGAAECTISPGLLIITGSWYTKREHPVSFGAIAALINYGVGTHAKNHPGGLAAWKGISLFLGSLTIVLSVVVFFVLGTPREVPWLNERERKMAIARTVANQTGSDRAKHEKFKWNQFRNAFKDPQTYFFFFITVTCQMPNGGVTTFGNLVYTSFGFSALDTLVKGTIPQSLVSVAHFIVVGLVCLRWPKTRFICTLLSIIPAFVGMLCLGLIKTTPRIFKWGLFLMTVTGNILLASNVAGRTKKSVTATILFVAYCTGNAIGAQLFQAKDAPRYIPALIACACLFGVEFVGLVLWRYYYIFKNAQRDRRAAALGLTETDIEHLGRLAAEADTDDYENEHFRYSI
ncbi:major facilitator superfamily domain-containing protein [Naematelia encephala]|uniref:Major facilitator superfamily domain-containing protein n=1 Tax=Naematelia encephala TaxID=71784 RepID=A0A1Y2AN84_9TREE|nr:major facilitator superfamily domain-containing protein [Naematelia encephala]